MNPYVYYAPTQQNQESRWVGPVILIGTLLWLAVLIGGYWYKTSERANCVAVAQASGIGYQWSWIGGCMYENPITGTWYSP